MYIKIENHDEYTTRVIDHPLSVSQFVKVHFLAFGFYGAERISADKYAIWSKSDGVCAYTISKATKADTKAGAQL